MQLTKEQQKAVDEFVTERDVKVVAYAGAGKTSTLVAMANADDVRGGLYVAFNKRIAEEADAKFPFNVRCSTAHSLAFRAMRNRYSPEKLTKNPRMSECTRKTFEGIAQNGQARPISLGNSRELIARTLRKFMHSCYEHVSIRAVPDLVKLGFMPAGEAFEDQRKKLAQEIASEASRIWDQMIDPRNPLPLGFDGYLKLWALAKPRIETDILFLDEAQDLNPVLIDVARRQQCQVVCVGDSHQQIYEWRGAVDALDKLDGKKVRLTQSFRFGEKIAGVANIMLDKLGETHPLVGVSPVEDRVHSYLKDFMLADVDAILCRSNGGVIECAAAALDKGLDVFVPGGVTELLTWIQDARLLKEGHAARPGELMGFQSWEDVREFAQTSEGGHLSVFVRLVDDYGVNELERILRRVLPEPEDGALTISTTHKAKGLEWKNVRVHSDFMINRKADDSGNGSVKVAASQVRLLYVAMTRAREELWLPQGIVHDYQNAEVA